MSTILLRLPGLFEKICTQSVYRHTVQFLTQSPTKKCVFGLGHGLETMVGPGSHRFIDLTRRNGTLLDGRLPLHRHVCPNPLLPRPTSDKRSFEETPSSRWNRECPKDPLFLRDYLIPRDLFRPPVIGFREIRYG